MISARYSASGRRILVDFQDGRENDLGITIGDLVSESLINSSELSVVRTSNGKMEKGSEPLDGTVVPLIVTG